MPLRFLAAARTQVGQRVLRTLALTVGVMLVTAALAIAATVTVIHSGKHVRLRPGDTLRVQFTGSFASTGYSWRVTSKPKSGVLERLASQVKPAGSCSAGTVGCPEHMIFRYRAEHAGSTRIGFRLFPPGAASRPTSSFSVTVAVS